MKRPQAADAMKPRQSFALIHIGLLVLAGVLLSGCGQQAPPPTRQSAPVEAKEQVRPATTQAPAETEHPNAGAAGMASTAAVKMSHAAPAAPARSGAVSNSAAIEGEPVSCAVVPDGALGLADSAAFNLLGVELSKKPGLALLERAEVARVMKERSLQLALAAGGVGERRALGTLLKARLLVILRAEERTVNGKVMRLIGLTACDADSGIRMLQDEAPWDDAAPQRTAESLARGILQARAKLSEKLEAVVAVPPLVSDDLTHQYDAMQDAYAQVLGGQFASVPGLQVVELDEVQALREEQRLTGGEATRRPLAAFFVSGQYRNNGMGAARRIDLSLELRQGERVIDRAELKGAAPQNGTAFLGAKAGEFAGKMIARRKAAFAAEAEAKELERKADTLASLGEDARALGLLEAALLIRPESAELHRKAAERCGAIADASFYDPGTHGLERYREGARKGIAALMRGCEHLESYLISTTTQMPQTNNIPRSQRVSELHAFWLCGRRIFEFRKNDPEVEQMVSELGKARRALMLATYEFMARQKMPIGITFWEGMNTYEDTVTTGSGTIVRNESYDYLDFYLRSCPLIIETPAEACAARLRVIKSYYQAHGEEAVHYCEPYVTRFLPTDTAEYRDFLNQLQAMPGAKWQAFIRKIQSEAMAKLVQDKKEVTTQPQAVITPRVLKAQPRHTPAPKIGGDYHLVPIPEVAFYPAGWITCGTAGDLIWKRDRVCVMRQKGKLETLMQATAEDPVVRVTFDGRYAWVVMHNRLLVFDPARGRMGEVTAKDGLPPGEMMAAPLAPGRVCVVGAFDRAWCAVVEFAGRKGHVDVFHEARLKTGDWLDAGVAFQPAFMTTLRDKAHPESPRVLVGRYMVGRGSHLPMLIDPAKHKVEVAPERISNMIRVPGITEHDGSAYWIEANTEVIATDGITARRERPSLPRSSKPNTFAITVEGFTPPSIKRLSYLMRFGPPHWKPEVVLNNVEDDPFYKGYFPLWEQAFHFVGFTDKQCFLFNGKGVWWADLEREQVVELKGSRCYLGDGTGRVFQSSHYGLVVYVDDGCFQFLPDFDPSRLANEANVEGGRKVLTRESLECRQLVVRLYKDWLRRPERYTTITVPINGEHFRMEEDAVMENIAMTVKGCDQQDLVLSDYIKDSTWFHISGNASNRGSADYYNGLPYYDLDMLKMKCSLKPIQVALQDALGNPLADAKVRLGYCIERNYFGTNNAETRYFENPTQTDAGGRLIAPYVLMDTGNVKSKLLEITYPNMDTITFCNWLDGQLQMDHETHIIRLPIVPRNAPEYTQALRGRVVDNAGKPIARALVWCNSMLLPGAGSFHVAAIPVICDQEGRFTLYPMQANARIKTLPPGTRFFIKIQHPDRPTTPAYSAILENDKEHTINWEAGLEPHRVTVKDETNREVDLIRTGIQIIYIGSAEEQTEAKRNGFGLLNRRANSTCGIIRAERGNEELIRRGIYQFSLGFNYGSSFEVTANSPQNIEVQVNLNSLKSPPEQNHNLMQNSISRNSPLPMPRFTLPPAVSSAPQTPMALPNVTPISTPEPPLPKVEVPEKPTWEEADGYWLKKQWAECREAMKRFAAQNAGSPHVWEARGKGVICLYHLQRYVSFGRAAEAFMKACPVEETEIRLQMEVKTQVEVPGMMNDNAGVLAGAKALLPRLKAGAQDWSTTMIWSGIALSCQAPPDYSAAAAAFDTVLKTGVQDKKTSRDSQMTNAAFWRGVIAQQQGDRAKEAEMRELLQGLPDSPSRKNALARLRPIK